MVRFFRYYSFSTTCVLLDLDPAHESALLLAHNGNRVLFEFLLSTPHFDIGIGGGIHQTLTLCFGKNTSYFISEYKFSPIAIRFVSSYGHWRRGTLRNRAKQFVIAMTSSLIRG